jgi:hypothetical protein
MRQMLTIGYTMRVASADGASGHKVSLPSCRTCGARHRMKSIHLLAATLLASGVLHASSLFGAVPQAMSLQGRLTNPSGTPLHGTYSLTFTIYDDPVLSAPGNVKWQETHPSVNVTDGLFNVLLGAGTPAVPLTASVLSSSNRYLGVKVGADPELSPRAQLTSTGYSLQALWADSASYAAGSVGTGGWTDDGTSVRLSTTSDNVGIGIASPVCKLDVRNNGGSGQVAIIRNDNAANNDPVLWVETHGQGAAVMGVSPYQYGLQGSSANSYGVYGTGSKGVLGYHLGSNHYGFLGSGNFGVFGKDSTSGLWGAIGGGNAGVYGEGSSPSNFGLYGYNGAGGIGILGGSTDSIAIRGTSANDIGVYGTGSKGVFGYHPSSHHYGFLGSQDFGVFGKDSTTGLWGAIGGGNAGVYGEGNGTSTYGLYGYNTGGGMGILGGSADSIAIHGASASNIGVYGTGRQGVYGKAGNGNFGYLGSSDYGVYGEHKDSANWGCLGGENTGVEGNSWTGYGVYARSYYGTGVYGSSNEDIAVYADGWHGTGLFARCGVGGSGFAARFQGPVKVTCMWDCTNAKALEVEGNVVLSQNDGQLILKTPDQNDAGRYRIKFDNNELAVLCGSDAFNQNFSFMTTWSAARTYDAHLKVHGSASSSWGKYIELYHDGNDGFITTDAGNIAISPALNVGIGTSAPSQKLDVNGTVRLRSIGAGMGTTVVADANGVLYKNSSSERYKTQIRELGIDPRKVLELSPARFNWKETGEEDIGLIAEQVEQVLPDLVIRDQEGQPDAVKYDKLAVCLLELIRSQQNEINALKTQVEELRSQR